MFTDGIFSADVTEGQFKKVVTDSITTEVICADTVKTNTFCSFSTFEVKNAFGEPVFTIEPNAGFDYAFNLVGNVMIQGGLAAESKQFLIAPPGPRKPPPPSL